MNNIQVSENFIPLFTNLSSFNQTKYADLALSLFDVPNRLLKAVDQIDSKIDAKIPFKKCQKAYDEYCEQLSSSMTLTLGKEFKGWLEEKGHGKWYEQVAHFLVRLPVKVAKNIIDILINTLKLVIIAPTYLVMHPVKFFLNLTKILINLTLPENLSRLGSGLMGTSAATAIVTNGFSAVTFIIGAALAFSGITLSTLKVGLIAEKQFKKEAIKNHLLQQGSEFIETFTTSFSLVMTVEAIHQVVRGFQKLGNSIKNSAIQRTAKNQYYQGQVNRYIASHDLPYGAKIDYPLTSDHYFNLKWDERAFFQPPKIDGAWYQGLNQEFSHYRYYWRDVWTYVPENDAWMYVPEQVSEAVYKNVHVYKVNIDMTNFVAPASTTLGAAHRLSNATMNTLGTTALLTNDNTLSRNEK